MAESYVQVAADGAGKKVRNASLTESQGVDTSGNAQADLVRYQQVVLIADGPDGDTVDWGQLKGINDQLQSIHELLEAILDALT